MLYLENGKVIQKTGGQIRIWDIPELLSAYDPLESEPLADRNALFQQIIPLAEERYDELSPAALLRYDFWKHIRLRNIEPKVYEYTTRISDTCHWRLELDPTGAFFTDLSGIYGPAGQVYAQLLSDFWFCGPLLPLPDLADRKWAVAQIRNAFGQVGGPAYKAHFPLFEYPRLEDTLEWTNGDHIASDFAMIRPYGVEYGRQNFHDGLVYLSFLSFEQILTRQDLANAIFTPPILEEIRQYLSPSPSVEEKPVPAANPLDAILARKERSKQLYMDNLGMPHYIHLDGFGDEYEATAQEEAQWQEELIDSLLEQLKDPERRDYVFSAFGRMWHSRRVREWVMDQLEGRDDFLFQKAAGILRMWSLGAAQGSLDESVFTALQSRGNAEEREIFENGLDQVRKVLLAA